MEFENKPLKWDNAGSEPSTAQKQSGYAAGGKLPAAHLNFLIKNKQLVEEELQEKITGLDTAVTNKVDKVEGKGLSSNDYTDGEKLKLAGLNNTQVVDSLISNDSNAALSANQGKILNESKVAVAGGTITGNLTVNGTFTNAGINAAFDAKVDKVGGKGLSSNDYTNEEKLKLAGLNNIQVVDNLTSSAPNLALSAKQGKVLNDNKWGYHGTREGDENLNTLTAPGIYELKSFTGMLGSDYPIQTQVGYAVLEVHEAAGTAGTRRMQKVQVPLAAGGVAVFERWKTNGQWSNWIQINDALIDLSEEWAHRPGSWYTCVHMLNIVNGKFKISGDTRDTGTEMIAAPLEGSSETIGIVFKHLTPPTAYVVHPHDSATGYIIEEFAYSKASEVYRLVKPSGVSLADCRWFKFTGTEC